MFQVEATDVFLIAKRLDSGDGFNLYITSLVSVATEVGWKVRVLWPERRSITCVSPISNTYRQGTG